MLWVEVKNSVSHAVLMCFPPFLSFKMSMLIVMEYFKTRWKLQCEALRTIFSADTISLKSVIPTGFGSECQEMPKLG